MDKPKRFYANNLTTVPLTKEEVEGLHKGDPMPVYRADEMDTYIADLARRVLPHYRCGRNANPEYDEILTELERLAEGGENELGRKMES